MHILIIVDCYYPSTKSSAKLVHDLGVELHRQGNEVTIMTPSEAVTKDVELSLEDGLHIARVKTGKIKGASKLWRGVNEVRLSAVLWRKGKRLFQERPCELIIFYSPSIFFGGLVHKLKALWRCPAYLILRDIFPQWTVDAGVLRKGMVYNFFRRKELAQYAVADVIGVQSPANLEYFATQFPHHKYRLEALYNWTTLDEGIVPASDYRNQLGLQGKVVFFYGGNIGVAQDMDNIIRLAHSLDDQPRIHFLLVGDGSEAPRLKALIAERNLRNITILPAVGQREYLAMLAEFDVGLISLERKLQTQNFPGKMLGYMYYSMPILASINPNNDLKTIIEAGESGICCVNGEDEKFRLGALTLAGDAALRRKMGQNARRLLEENFSVNSCAKQILANFPNAATAALRR